MKYIKFLMLTVVAVLMASCSNDDDSTNSKSTTVGFTNPTVVVKENTGIFRVPISIEGKRNGDIHFTVEVEETGANPAKEDVNYLITSKKLVLPNDTTGSATLGVEIKTVDDNVINENRTFKLKITNIKGGDLATSECIVTLRDNDAAFYEKFFGKWTMTAIDNKGKPLEKTITITGPSDEEDPAYNNVLTATGIGLLNVGVALDVSWHFNYSFDPVTKKGTLGFVMGEEVATYSTSYSWIWVTDNGASYTTDDLTTEWALGENDTFPTEFTWSQTFEEKGPALYLYQMGAGAWASLSNIKITKQ